MKVSVIEKLSVVRVYGVNSFFLQLKLEVIDSCSSFLIFVIARLQLPPALARGFQNTNYPGFSPTCILIGDWFWIQGFLDPQVVDSPENKNLISAP
jgi:hypothetical protein